MGQLFDTFCPTKCTETPFPSNLTKIFPIVVKEVVIKKLGVRNGVTVGGSPYHVINLRAKQGGSLFEERWYETWSGLGLTRVCSFLS